ASAAPAEPVSGETLPQFKDSGAPLGNQFAALSAVPSPVAASDDEETAETRRAPDENFSVIHAEAPQLASAAQAPQPVAVPAVPPLASKPQPAAKPAAKPPVLRPSQTPAAQPSPRPAPLVAAATPKPRPDFNDKLAALFQAPPAAKPAPAAKQMAAKEPAKKPAVTAMAAKPDAKLAALFQQANAPAKKVAAAVPPQPAQPSLRPDVGEGDVDQPGVT